MDRAGFDQQMDKFHNAQIIIGTRYLHQQVFNLFAHSGGHGAGMTNMLFAPAGATVVELPLNPHIDRSFGYMALALGLDYWVVPEISASYLYKYIVDQRGADAFKKTLRHIITSKGLQELLVPRDEL